MPDRLAFEVQRRIDAEARCAKWKKHAAAWKALAKKRNAKVKKATTMVEEYPYAFTDNPYYVEEFLNELLEVLDPTPPPSPSNAEK